MKRADRINFDWTATCTGVILKHAGNHGFGETLPGYLNFRGSITFHIGSKVQLLLFGVIVTNKYVTAGFSNYLGDFGLVNSGVISRYYTRYAFILHVIDNKRRFIVGIFQILERP